MAKTISANRGQITLNSSTSTYNPLTILSGVTVSALTNAIAGDNSAAWTITNAGTVSSSFGYGIELEGGGTVTNSGRINAGATGVRLKGSPAVVLNSGSISGDDDGVILSAGGTVNNIDKAASISGSLNGVYCVGGSGSVTNQGTITGTGANSDGVYFLAGGTVVNGGTSASISGGQWGVFVTGRAAATVSNAGTISGAEGAVHFADAIGNEFYLSPGGVTNGVVQGGTDTDTLVLGHGKVIGAISGIGSRFVGFETLDVKDHSQWLATGSNTITTPMQVEVETFAALRVGGTLTAPGNLSIAGATGSSFAAIDGGRVEVGTAGTARAGQIVIDAGHTLAQSGTVTLKAPVIINRGTVIGGLAVSGASSVTNGGTAALISGGGSGIVIQGGVATVLNQGSINGGSLVGVYLSIGGTLTNSGTAARIAGEQAAVGFVTGQATLLNQGTLIGSLGKAVYFDSGVVTNAGTAADIAGYTYGVFASGPATVTNQGSISATSALGTAVGLKANGVVTNAGTAATISGGFCGIYGGGGTVFVTNQGTISGFDFAVSFSAGGTVANNGTAALLRGEIGVISEDLAATVTNQGTIAGTYDDGVFLIDGGVVTNSGSAADITGERHGVSSYDVQTTVTNDGRMIGTSGDGVLVLEGGTVANSSVGAVIAGENWGVYARKGAAAVTNQGSIIGTIADGVYLHAGGAVCNAGTSARINGGQSGVYAGGAAATITNQGSIIGTAAYGVFLEAGGSVTNSGTAAHIVGALYGVGASLVAATIVNQGSIFGNDGAIYLGAGGTVANSGTASLLSGERWGVYAYGGAADTVTNQGTISGGNGAVHFDNADGNDFQDFPGAVAIGVVQGGTGADTLELGSATATGTIAGIGSAFSGFEALVVDTGAHWLITGANTLATTASIGVTGTGSLGVAGTLTAPGNLAVAGLGTLAASGGRIEVGIEGAALANQIVVDAGHTLRTSGVLSSASLRVSGLFLGVGTVTGAVANSGKVDAAGGLLTLAATVSGSGILQANGGATLTLDGASNSAASILNLGKVILSAGDVLDVSGSVNPASTGIFVLTNASVLEVAADTGASNAISFLGASGDKLVIDTVGQFGSNVGLGSYAGPKLENFATVDAIDLKNLLFGTATIDSYTAASGLLQLHSGATKATLLFDNATLGGGNFHLGPDTGTGTVLTRS